VTRYDDERLDRAIDDVARRMLDVEPPAGLRGRVVDRLSDPERRPMWMWLAVPAAAMLALLILWPRAGERTLVTPRAGADIPLPAGVAARHPETEPDVTRPIAAARQATARARRVRAAALEELPPVADAGRVAPLAAPPPIALGAIADGHQTPIDDIAVDPIQIRALQVNALSEAPANRREE
jgi:hypothetical protein